MQTATLDRFGAEVNTQSTPSGSWRYPSSPAAGWLS